MCRGEGGAAWTLQDLLGLGCAEHLFICLLIVKHLCSFGNMVIAEETLQ